MMELRDVAEEGGFGEELADEGVHRLGDALEREHLGDEQVHDVGLEAGVVLERAGQLVGEAGAGCGVAMRAVLDFAVVVAHGLLEDEVDEGAPLVACAGGVGEVFVTARAVLDGELGDVGAGAGTGVARLISVMGYRIWLRVVVRIVGVLNPRWVRHNSVLKMVE